MDFEDFLEPEIAVAAAVTAAVTSPQVRKALRRGAVFGLAGLIAAGDAVTTFSKSVGRGVQQATATASSAAQQATSNLQAAMNTSHDSANGAAPTSTAGEPQHAEHAEGGTHG